MGDKNAPTVHIYTRGHQPATRFRVDFGDFRVIDELGIRAYVPDVMWFRIKPRALVWTHCCKRRRQAQHCTTQAYYDVQPFWCRPGRGCKA